MTLLSSKPFDECDVLPPVVDLLIIRRAPIMGGHKLNLHELFKAVTKLQGFEKVQEQKKWRELAHHLGVPRTCTSATAQLRSI